MKLVTHVVAFIMTVVAGTTYADASALRGLLGFRGNSFLIMGSPEAELSFRPGRGSRDFLINHLRNRPVSAHGFEAGSIMSFNRYILFEGFRHSSISVFANHVHAHGQITRDSDNRFILQLGADPIIKAVRLPNGRISVRTEAPPPLEVPLSGDLIHSSVFKKARLLWKAKFDNKLFNLSGNFTEHGELEVHRISPVVHKGHYTTQVNTEDLSIPVLAEGELRQVDQNLNIVYNGTLRDFLKGKTETLTPGKRIILEGWHDKGALDVRRIYQMSPRLTECSTLIQRAQLP